MSPLTRAHRSPHRYVPWGSNFGDEIGPVLARHIMGGSCGPEATANHKTASKPLVGGLGSTLHLHCTKGKGPTIIWGSGATETASWQCAGREPSKVWERGGGGVCVYMRQLAMVHIHVATNEPQAVRQRGGGGGG